MKARDGRRQDEQGIPVALTFDDVSLVPDASVVLPEDVSLTTSLATASRLTMSLPLLSAAMDTVTEQTMAIEMARAGGLGVIHRNNSAAKQAEQVAHVKRYESGIVANPVCVAPDQTIADANQIKMETGYSGLPVVERDKVVGIVTNRDLRFETRLDRKIAQVMTPRSKLITVPPRTGLNRARSLMHQHRIERVIVEDSRQRLCGLITVKDILLSETYPDACKDDSGRLRVGAAIGINDIERAEALNAAAVDALVVDTAHAHSAKVISWARKLRKRFRETILVVGNIATASAARALADAGADVVKVGVGPGSICTTRIIAGIGIPQFTAIRNVAAELGKGKSRPGIIADGGIRYSGDAVKALAAGADAVMLGGMLAGTAESPGETELFHGRVYKNYRGMGSIGAMVKGSAERYFQTAATDPSKLIPEGVEGRVPFKGPAQGVITQLAGGLRAALGYVGAATIGDLHRKTKFVRVTQAGMRESHVHDVELTKETPNYHIK